MCKMKATGLGIFLLPILFLIGAEAANRTRSCIDNLLDENYGLGECGGGEVACREPKQFGRYRRGAEFRPYRDGQQKELTL